MDSRAQVQSYSPDGANVPAALCHELYKNGWTDRFAFCVVDSGGPMKAQVQSYLPGGANVPSWEGTLAPPAEYNWTVNLRRQDGLMSNYFDHLFRLEKCAEKQLCDFQLCSIPATLCCLRLFFWVSVPMYFPFSAVNLPLHHKVHKFSSGTAHPDGPRKRAVKGLWW